MRTMGPTQGSTTTGELLLLGGVGRKSVRPLGVQVHNRAEVGRPAGETGKDFWGSSEFYF